MWTYDFVELMNGDKKMEEIKRVISFESRIDLFLCLFFFSLFLFQSF